MNRRPAPWLTTGDPTFDPRGGLFVNGYAFVPLAAARELIDRCEEEYSDTFLAGRDAARDALDSLAPVDPIAVVPSAPGPAERERRAMVEARGRYVAPSRPAFATGYALNPCRVRQEGDEYVCSAHGCGRRWAVDEEKPYCANDPVWRD